MVESFAARFALVRARYGPLVWGVDPSGQLLDRWELGDNPDGLDRFADTVLETAIGSTGIIKPQSAFYERHGWRGIRTLTRLVAGARAAGILVIVDAKRGDVGSTNDAYAEAYLGKGAPIEADALTVHPYLGLDAMGAFVSRAHEAGSCLFVVTRSSNPEGRMVQGAAVRGGGTVEAALLERIGELNAFLAPGVVGPVGAVVSATSNGPELDLVTPQGLYLAPGVGAQGTTPEDVACAFRSCPDRVLPSASRSLLAAGPAPSSLRSELQALGETFRRLLGE
jgi:orotidine-5'-phosphate decarboxylase